LRGLALNFANTHQTENPQGFSEVGENKQLLIAIVGGSFFTFLNAFAYGLWRFRSTFLSTETKAG
jgi:hypothetical protein